MNAPLSQPSEPYDFPRRILLMVTGRTPQVVTETLYAIAVRPQSPARPFIPTEVHLITTAEGAQDARLALLDPKDGWFHRLCADYGLNGIAFSNSSNSSNRSQCGSAMPRNLAGATLAWEIARYEPSIESGGVNGNGHVDASARKQASVKVTGGADLESVEPRKIGWVSADGFVPPASHNCYSVRASGAGTPRGPRPCRA